MKRYYIDGTATVHINTEVYADNLDEAREKVKKMNDLNDYNVEAFFLEEFEVEEE